MNPLESESPDEPEFAGLPIELNGVGRSLEALEYAVALGIGRVIARKALEGDKGFQRLDGLGQVMAITQTAGNMARELREEARAAVRVMEAYRSGAEDSA